jgi:hypothetical protein
MSIEFTFDITRKTTFMNLCADSVFIYYIIMAGGVCKERRKTNRGQYA